MIISLIGFMGAGKSTIGKQLAQSIKCPFIDLDAYIEEKDIYQVTMNITDYTKTSVYRAFEAVRMEARRYEVDVIGSEFIGLVALDCLRDIAAYYLHLPSKEDVELSLSETVRVVCENFLVHGFHDQKVIEYHL